jgi:hypothetical protein
MAVVGAAGAWIAASSLQREPRRAGLRGRRLGRQRPLGLADGLGPQLAPGLCLLPLVPLFLRARPQRDSLAQTPHRPRRLDCHARLLRGASTRSRTRSCPRRLRPLALSRSSVPSSRSARWRWAVCSASASRRQSSSPCSTVFGKAPRLIESNETLDLGAFFTLLTSRDQAFYSRPARVSPMDGTSGACTSARRRWSCLCSASSSSRGAARRCSRPSPRCSWLWASAPFTPSAPWPFFHENLPVFRSQHVPSRFLYPAVLTSGPHRRGRPRPLGREAQSLAEALARCAARPAPSSPSAWTSAWSRESPWKDRCGWCRPTRSPRTGPFTSSRSLPSSTRSETGPGRCTWPCSATPGSSTAMERPPSIAGERARRRDPQYKGEARVEGGGKARWSSTGAPTGVTIEVEGAAEGARLVYNMNYDEGWSADSGPVMPWENTLSTPVGPNTRGHLLVSASLSSGGPRSRARSPWGS